MCKIIPRGEVERVQCPESFSTETPRQFKTLNVGLRASICKKKRGVGGFSVVYAGDPDRVH